MRGIHIRMAVLVLLSGFLLLALVESASAIRSVHSISSPTHPNQSTWYANNDPTLNWDSYPVDYSELGSYDTQGNSQGVAILGNYAYVADGDGGLQIIDVSDPANAAFAGYFDTPGTASAVFVSGSYAYVADGDGGLQIIDVSDPANAAFAGYFDTPGTASAVFVSGSYAYVADGDGGLQIIDVSDPANAAFAGYFDTPGSAHAVSVDGNYAYVVDDDLRVIDISDPANAALAAYYGTTGDTIDVTTSGNKAYIVDSGGHLQILDIQDPSNPIAIGSYTPQVPSGCPSCHVTFVVSYGGNVDVSGDIAYLSYSYVECYDCGTNSTAPSSGAYFYLEALDLSDPTNPTQINKMARNNPVNDISVSGDTIYLARGPGYSSYSSSGIDMIGITRYDSTEYSYVLDQSYSTNPDTVPEGTDTSVTYHDLPNGEYWFHIAIVEDGQLGPVEHYRIRVNTSCYQPDMVVNNPSPYWADLADFQARELTVDYTLANKGANDAKFAQVKKIIPSGGVRLCNGGYCDLPPLNKVAQLSYITTPNGGFPLYNTQDIAYANNHVYVSTHGTPLRVFDVTDPTDPVYIPPGPGWISTPGASSVGYEVEVSGNYAYVVTSVHDLLIYDVSSNPVKVGWYSDFSNAMSVAISGGYAFVADYNRGLCVLDLNDPANPVLVGCSTNLAPSNYWSDIEISGNFAYMVNEASGAGLYVIDISNPSQPVLVGSFSDVPTYMHSVDVSGNYAYLTNPGEDSDISADLTIVDVSDPSAPTLAGSYLSPGMTTSDVDVSGNFAYLAANNGLNIIDISDPANPTHVGMSGASYATAVAVNGEYAYVADFYDGLLVFNGYSSDPPVITYPGEMVAGQSHPFSVKLKVPEGLGHFQTSFTGSAEDVCGNSYDYGG